MTNNQSNRNGGGRWNAQTNQGTPSPTSKSTAVAVSVEDIKNSMFTFDKNMLDNYIVSSERFLMYAGSMFGPSENCHKRMAMLSYTILCSLLKLIVRPITMQ